LNVKNEKMIGRDNGINHVNPVKRKMKKLVLLLLILAMALPVMGGSVCPFTTIFMRTLLDDADLATARATLQMGVNKTPASASAVGIAGEIAWDTDYIYVAVATNTWKRVAIATWGAAPENVIYAGENVIFAAEQVVYP